MNRSRIPWLVNADGSAGYTWSPMSGCGPGLPCYERCWARAYHVRYRGGDFSVKLHPSKLDEPLRLRKPSTIGVCLMGDLFHDDVPDDFILAVFGIMVAAERHTFIVPTKRPGRLAFMQAGTVGSPIRLEACWQALRSEVEHHPLGDSGPLHRKWSADPDGPWPLPNVHLGVSVWDQPSADAMIPILLDTPAAHRLVSLEPQIGPVSFDPEWMMGLSLVIQGCESGARRRPFDVAWARSVRAECAAARVAYALKQMPIGGRIMERPGLDDDLAWSLPWVKP